ncbi:MAG: PLP-dependent aminotransferase family protein [Lachnospiraceae bacterium]
MLTYTFSNRGNRSLYEHLYQCIKDDILSGILPTDTKLPSKRSFAKNLGVSTLTVETAYAQLVAEGYLYSLPKKGYYVSEILRMPATLQSNAPTSILSQPPKHHYFADFSSNQTRPENFPFSVWAKLMREVLTEYHDELMTNSPAQGIIQLRQAIAHHLHQFRGMDVDPEQIIVGAGTEYLYGLLIQLLGHGKTYGVEDPGYQKIRNIYQSNDVNCVGIPMDKNGLRIPQLYESNADIIHISPSHHFPTGIITPVSRRLQLLEWANQEDGRYIIEDDYDCEFRLMGKPIPSLQSIDQAKRVIYINTFTKSLASTIRISYMILPAHLVTRFRETMGFYSCTVSTFEQYTLARFINEGYFEKHINRMRNFYRLQRDRIRNEIKKSPLAPYVHITEETAGLHFLMHVDTELTDEQILANANRQDLRLSCLSGYYEEPPKDASHTFIINYSSLKPETIEEAVRRLCYCLTLM